MLVPQGVEVRVLFWAPKTKAPFMDTKIFTFDLPMDLIAQHPVHPRDTSRLLRVFPDGRLEDHHMFDLDTLLKPTDVLVFNNTKVIPARLFGYKGDAKIEVTLFKQQGPLDWETLIKNARRLKTGDIITFNAELQAQVLEKSDQKTIPIRFLCPAEDLMPLLHKIGTMPLPPYIKRPHGATKEDAQTYQTIYAKKEGAVAAPTAGLHYTPELMDRLKAKGIEMLFITLHVGGGTFLPVTVTDTKDHIMHKEYGHISKEIADKINTFKAQGRRIIPVGTTSLRLLESAADDTGIVHPFSKETGIFITPGYKFKITDALLTNFHLSGSTLFMLVCALMGIDTMHAAYKHAIQEQYRFFSYGDACLLEHNP